MKRYWTYFGIAVVAAGALYYPVMRLMKYIVPLKKKDEEKMQLHFIKAFVPAYRGKHKYSRRRNGHRDEGDAPKN